MEQKFYEESIKRMELIGLLGEVIKEFKNKGTTMCSDIMEAKPRHLTAKEKQIIREFESTYKGFVYHAIKDAYGMLSLMFVSGYEDEWEDEIKCLNDRVPIVYVYNSEDPLFSEFGAITLKRFAGMLYRG